MATAAATILLALRKLRVVGQGANPSSSQQTDAFTELKHMIREMTENGLGHPFIARRISSSYELETDYPAVRLQLEAGGLTVTLPKGDGSRPVRDGMMVDIVDAAAAFSGSNVTVARNGWKINGSAGNETLSASRRYFFRAELGDWKTVSDMASVSADLPFPTEFDYGIALMLAKRLEGEYGQPLGPADSRAASNARRALYARYVKPGDVSFEHAVAMLGESSMGATMTEGDFLAGRFS